MKELKTFLTKIMPTSLLIEDPLVRAKGVPKFGKSIKTTL